MSDVYLLKCWFTKLWLALLHKKVKVLEEKKWRPQTCIKSLANILESPQKIACFKCLPAVLNEYAGPWSPNGSKNNVWVIVYSVTDSKEKNDINQSYLRPVKNAESVTFVQPQAERIDIIRCGHTNHGHAIQSRFGGGYNRAPRSCFEYNQYRSQC